MCTLSLFRGDDGYRVFMNRDERHDRTPELPPQIINKNPTITAPVDPNSGGTWIAHNDKGYWGALLNGYTPRPDHIAPASKSRGGILIDVLGAVDPLQAMQDLDPHPYENFRLVIGNTKTHHMMRWDGTSYKETDFLAVHEDRIFFTTSSSWQQDSVMDIRKKLFEQWLNDQSYHENGVPDFHYSTAPNLESAPLMYRSYSGTKSITAMNVCAGETTMSYWKNSGDIEALKQAVI